MSLPSCAYPSCSIILLPASRSSTHRFTPVSSSSPPLEPRPISPFFHAVSPPHLHPPTCIPGINSNSPYEYRATGDETAAHPNRSIITLVWLVLLWVCRSLEVAVFAKRESSRRQGSADAIVLLGVLVFWLGAHFAAYWDTLTGRWRSRSARSSAPRSGTTIPATRAARRATRAAR